MNSRCQWIDSSPRALDLRRPRDREHLRTDVQLAWDLGVRFGDVRFRTTPTLARPLVEQCRGMLYDSIMARHRVTRSDIARATWARVWWVDIALVFLPMTALTLFSMNQLMRRMQATIGNVHRGKSMITAAFFVVLVGLVAAGATQYWAISVESFRLRNEHVGGRAALLPSVAHHWATLICAVVLCVAVGAWRLHHAPVAGFSPVPGARDEARAGRG